MSISEQIAQLNLHLRASYPVEYFVSRTAYVKLQIHVLGQISLLRQGTKELLLRKYEIINTMQDYLQQHYDLSFHPLTVDFEKRYQYVNGQLIRFKNELHSNMILTEHRAEYEEDLEKALKIIISILNTYPIN